MELITIMESLDKRIGVETGMNHDHEMNDLQNGPWESLGSMDEMAD